VKERNQVIRYQLMQLGRVVIDLNQERGKSAFINDYHNNHAKNDRPTQRTHTKWLSLISKQNCVSIDVRLPTVRMHGHAFLLYCGLDTRYTWYTNDIDIRI